MKLFVSTVLLAGLTLLGTGCATAGYSASEREKMIARNWEFDGKQIVDDFDSAMMLRPASRMTIWNIR